MIEFDGDMKWLAYIQYRIRQSYKAIEMSDDDSLFEESITKWEELVYRMLVHFGIDSSEAEFIMNGNFLWEGWHEYSIDELTWLLQEESDAWAENDEVAVI
jgi:hypothetical protein